VNRRADGKTQCRGFETDKEIRKESPKYASGMEKGHCPREGESYGSYRDIR